MIKISITEKFISEQTTGEFTHEFANGINYRFYKTNDDWIAIIEINQYQGNIPIIQAKDRAHALDYIAMIEPVPFQCSQLC